MKKLFSILTTLTLLPSVFVLAQQVSGFSEVEGGDRSVAMQEERITDNDRSKIDDPYPAKKTVVRVMTYNVHHCNPPSVPGKIDVEAIAKVINEANPDLVALQEIDVFTSRSGKALHQARELARLTNMYSYFGKALDFSGGEYGVAILSKFPIVDSAVYALPMTEGSGGEPRAMAVVTLVLKNGKKLKFASTHLDLKTENRLLQVQKIRSLLANEKDAVILAGDFNDQAGSETIRDIDSFLKRSCKENCGLTIPQVNPNKEIDFIMFTPSGFKVKSHRVINESYASDHLPVLAELLVVK